MGLADATWTTTTFCRKCKKLRGCLDTHESSEYRYLCKACATEEKVVGTCRSCGREGVEKELNKQGGYCWHCYNENIHECNLCGAEIYSHNIINGMCTKCATGNNKACVKCGTCMSSNKLSNNGLCDKCSIKIHKKLRSSKVNEVVECVECSRECYVNDLNDDGLCIYCYANELESEIVNLKKRKKTYY